MPLTLTWSGSTSLPVEASGLDPEAFAALDATAAAKRPIPIGNAVGEIGDVFRVGGDGGDGSLVFEGDLRHVRGLGQGMKSGSVVVRGPVGPRLGAEMSGGRIDVEGDVGGWAGAEMRGGELRIRGRAGDALGAAFPGSRLGMREGVILVEGSAGADVGLGMRRGLIAVGGDVGDGFGRAMIAGTLFACAGTGRRIGAGMKRGTVVLATPARHELLPTFARAGRFRPPFLALYLKRLRAWGFPVPETASAGPWERYNGDLVEGGQGEILVAAG
jgi:formylmethanofuran dehydrogenase subunit C